ncbi:MAG: bifunctional folylpolyglutamate synthase/dihydrofolate synthase [Thermoleophilia bacterium]|nr:bifunctional folylpolyglutamate synthase/dihydrofolate synthase [Thermoleophilia bacterium]
MAAAETVGWLERLGFFGIHLGLERMHALLDRFHHPERRFRSLHVVGTNGKTSVSRTAEALLLAEGLSVGTYTSPHVTDWPERIRIDGADIGDFVAAVERVRHAAEEVGASQFEVLTVAALVAFAQAGVDVAVVEAGLGGRLDATNVVDAEVVVLTNVALEHVEHLGRSREEIAREKLAVVRPGATVVLAEPEWEAPARDRGAARVVVVSPSNLALAHAAAEALVGRPLAPRSAGDVSVPGRLEKLGEQPLEIWDGAHNTAGVEYLLARLPRRDWVLVLSILADKDADRMLAAFAPLGRRLVATTSGYSRALAPEELARRARPFFDRIETVADPIVARVRGREAASPDGALLVSGSLYLVAALAAVRHADVAWGPSANV